MAPLPLPEGTTTVLVSPYESLRRIPWSALFEVPAALVFSGTELVRLRSERPDKGKDVLALGDPVRRPPTSGAAATAPETLEEARAVGDVVLLGPDASQPALAAALSRPTRWRAVHLACPVLLPSRAQATGSLAMSPTGEDDGVLTVAEVLGLKVLADLLVLPVCAVEEGEEHGAGTAMAEITLAFMMYAGAPRVIYSPSRADPEARKALMLKFYELWDPKEGNGLPAAEALRKAQDFIRAQEEWADPKHWASWVLWGLPE